MGDFLSTLKDNWAVIAAAPLAFAIWTAVILAACWALVSHLKTNQIGNLDSRIALRDDEIADYKRKLEGATPEEAAQKIARLEEAVARLQPASFTKEQLMKLTKAIENIKGTMEVYVDGAYPDGPSLAAQLIEAFRDAGWSASSGMVIGPANRPPNGIEFSNAPEVAPELRSATLNALAEAGLRFAIFPMNPPHWKERGAMRLTLTQPSGLHAAHFS